MTDEIEFSPPEAVPLLEPIGGTPNVISSEEDFAFALATLESGTGAFAIDAERASGYKYSSRAYLIQIKRADGGLHLIDPIAFHEPNATSPHRLFKALNELIRSDEVILHASTQDLPCLREVGLNPSQLFDTELGGRIAGLPRVGLGALLENLLGISLAKEHSAVDWSHRPLPIDWLTYAALDVELLLELRDVIGDLLQSQGKLDWARQEFASILQAPPSPPRKDPWRRSSGIHKIKKRDQLAIIKAIWHERDALAQQLDISPGKLLSDAALLELAVHTPKTKAEMEKVLKPIGSRARWFEHSAQWLSAIRTGRAVPESHWPSMRGDGESLPPVKIWRDKYPEKFAPLSHARAEVEKKAQELSIPPENLISPEIIRRICWSPPGQTTDHEDADAVFDELAALGARPWQCQIVAPIVARALTQRTPVVVPDSQKEP